MDAGTGEQQYLQHLLECGANTHEQGDLSKYAGA